MANSTWQSYPLQGLRNYQSNHLLGKHMVRNNIFTSRIFFQKKTTCFVQFQKRQQGSGVPDTSESGPYSRKTSWMELLHGDGAWGTALFEDIEAMILVWYWQTSIYLDTCTMHAIKLWGYAFSYVAYSLNFPLNCWIHFEFRLGSWCLFLLRPNANTQTLQTQTAVTWILLYESFFP